MSLIPVLVTAPTEPVVSTDEMKDHLNVTFSDDDDHISSLVQAATDHLDGYSGILGRCLINQVWRVDIEHLPQSSLLLPFPDVSAVAIKYRDVDDIEQTLDASVFELVELVGGTELRFRGAFLGPSVSSVRETPISIMLTAGFGDASKVPKAIKLVVMLLVSHWYDPRGAKPDVAALITPYRRGGL